MHYGISDISFYFPYNYLNFELLLAKREKEESVWGDKLRKALKITGQKGMRFPFQDQDSAVLGAEAFSKILKQSPRDMRQLRVFLAATETGLDHSKSLSSYISEILKTQGIELTSQLATFQIQHACAAGIYGVLVSLSLIQTGSKRFEKEWGMVVASDISRYEAPSTAEITQGAGAAAVLVEANPQLLRIDLSNIGYSSQGVDDFFRPLGSLTAQVKGRYSVECFNSSLREAFLDFCERKQNYPEAVLASASMIILHTPYANMPAFALEKILREFYSQDEDKIQDYLHSRYVKDSTQMAAEVGNTYTASVFMTLACGLKAMYDKIGHNMVGRRVLIASYGSGNTMIFFETIITPSAPNVIANWDWEPMLKNKEEASWKDYLNWLKGKGKTLIQSEQTGFFLKNIREDGYRIYDKK